MNGCDTLESIRELNLSYLSLVQRMLRENREEGMEKLGLSALVAHVLTELSQTQALKLASCDQLICHFSSNDRTMVGALGEPARETTTSAQALLLAEAARRSADAIIVTV